MPAFQHKLHHHLTHDHGRVAHEIAGLPLASVHRLEHVEADLGLLHLGHSHAGDELSGGLGPSEAA